MRTTACVTAEKPAEPITTVVTSLLIMTVAGESLVLGFLSLGGLVDERLVDVRNDTTSGNGSLDESIQLFVTPNGQLQVTRRDTLDLEILAGVSSQLEDFGGQVLQDSRSVDRSSGSDTVSLVNGVLQETVNTTDGELKTGLGRSRLWCLLAGGGLASLSSFSALSSFARLW